MCAIIDNSARDEVFGSARSPRATAFLKWLEEGHTKLVLGGRLLAELAGGDDQPGSASFKRWLRTAEARGFAYKTDGDVDGQTEYLEAAVDQRRQKLCRSDDPHVLALARVTGARLLFTNDRNLIQDFQNNAILRGPSGKVYPTTDYHQFLHDRNNYNLCSGMRY